MLSVFNDQDKEVASSIFKVTNNDIVLERSVIPAMLTMNIQVIRDDCLGYFMEEYPITEALLSI
jgi:hypothetical protein